MSAKDDRLIEARALRDTARTTLASSMRTATNSPDSRFCRSMTTSISCVRRSRMRLETAALLMRSS